jgi:hypothetical protein
MLIKGSLRVSKYLIMIDDAIAMLLKDRRHKKREMRELNRQSVSFQL